MRTKTFPFLVATLSLLPFLSPANDIEPGKEFYTVPRAANPIVLDGNLSEWAGVPVLADPKFYVKRGAEGTAAGKGSGGVDADLVLFERYNGGDWTGPDDHTSAVQIVYDADNIYFGFVVTDEYHENAANSAWNGDSVQLMIANSNRTAQVALYNYALGGVEDTLGTTIVEHEAGPGGTEAVVTRNTNTHRTTYEIKLPKEALGLTSLAGAPQFGLGMAINDGDQATPGQKGWGGLGAHSIVFGKTPSETALITLTRGNDIEPGKEFYTATSTTNVIVLDGSLSDWPATPVLADPKFYIRRGAEGTAAGKGSAGVDADLVLFERYSGGDWTGPDDHTSAVQIVYDAQNVYFGFVVTDEYHENAANSAWNGDSVQLMVANSNRTAQVALYNYALGGIEDTLGTTIVEHEAGPGGTEAVVTRNTTSHRTIYEIKLPVASLGLSGLTLGTQFGLGMAINDGDQATPGQKGWGGLGAHSIVFGKTPSETALVTLGAAGGAGIDRVFYSAVNPTIDFFSFRVNNRGAAILAPATVRLVIDGQTNTPTATPRFEATDFTYTPPRPFAPGIHSYSIVARDTLGNIVTDSGTFTTPPYAFLTAADKVTPDLTLPGFIWRVHQNDALTNNSISRALQQLNGLLGENLADPNAQGPTFAPGVPGPTPNHPLTFEIEEVINLDEAMAAAGDIAGDAQMPGIPGLGASAQTDGIAADIITYITLPAGAHTFIVNSDDGFRTISGNINDIFQGQLTGQFDQPGGRAAADTAYTVRVAEAGTYAFRTIYQEGAGGASIEWKMVDTNNTEVLLNDRANGGFFTYRKLATGSTLPTGISMVSPTPGATAVRFDTPIFASITEGAQTVDINSVRLSLDGTQVAATPTRAGNTITLNYQPASLAPTQHIATLIFTAGGTSRTQSWNFTTAPALIWMVGRDDNDWPAGDGGGPNTSFIQENSTINPLPGAPDNPEVNQQGDNDYYFAGDYTTTIPSVVTYYGGTAYIPVGPVLANEEGAERAFAAADNDLRYHFNLPASLRSNDLLSVTFDANNLDTDNGGAPPIPTDPRYGIEVYFNGVLVQTQIVIRPAQLGIDYTTPPFTLASVNARTGPGFDNIVSLKGVNYSTEGGGNWMGIDYVQLNGAGSAATTSLRFTSTAVSGNQLTLNWTGSGQLESATSLSGPWTPVTPPPTSSYSVAITPGQARFYRLRQ